MGARDGVNTCLLLEYHPYHPSTVVFSPDGALRQPCSCSFIIMPGALESMFLLGTRTVSAWHGNLSVCLSAEPETQGLRVPDPPPSPNPNPDPDPGRIKSHPPSSSPSITGGEVRYLNVSPQHPGIYSCSCNLPACLFLALQVRWRFHDGTGA